MRKRFGKIEISLETAWDSALFERYLLPALAYWTTLHWGEKAIGHAQMGHSLVLLFWRWHLQVKYIVYDYPNVMLSTDNDKHIDSKQTFG